MFPSLGNIWDIMGNQPMIVNLKSVNFGMICAKIRVYAQYLDLVILKFD